jgi:deoxyadenosine/deoxycytidine kinase
MKHRYIAVEGPIGVGKTSLTSLLGSRLNAQKVLEDTSNPFIKDFYEEKEGAAFDTQVFFLLKRFRQQQEVQQGSLFKQVTIADYLFAKDRIFAYLNLSDADLIIYEKLYGLLAAEVPKPDAVVCLQARTEVLVQRIRQRRRGYEKNISPEYVAEVNEAFTHYFFHYRESPLLVVDTSDIDFVKKSADLNELIRQIELMDKGTQYYIPLGSR